MVLSVKWKISITVLSNYEIFGWWRFPARRVTRENGKYSYGRYWSLLLLTFPFFLTSFRPIPGHIVVSAIVSRRDAFDYNTFKWYLEITIFFLNVKSTVITNQWFLNLQNRRDGPILILGWTFCFAVFENVSSTPTLLDCSFSGSIQLLLFIERNKNLNLIRESKR